MNSSYSAPAPHIAIASPTTADHSTRSPGTAPQLQAVHANASASSSSSECPSDDTIRRTGVSALKQETHSLGQATWSWFVVCEHKYKDTYSLCFACSMKFTCHASCSHWTPPISFCAPDFGQCRVRRSQSVATAWPAAPTAGYSCQPTLYCIYIISLDIDYQSITWQNTNQREDAPRNGAIPYNNNKVTTQTNLLQFGVEFRHSRIASTTGSVRSSLGPFWVVSWAQKTEGTVDGSRFSEGFWGRVSCCAKKAIMVDVGFFYFAWHWSEFGLVS